LGCRHLGAQRSKQQKDRIPLQPSDRALTLFVFGVDRFGGTFGFAPMSEGTAFTRN